MSQIIIDSSITPNKNEEL
jgi:hypothetical protein